MDDTIYAFATPEGRSALAVLRISGTQCPAIIDRMLAHAPQPRRATLFKLRDPVDGSIVDQAMAIWNPGPASFTGEDCLEFYIHGGRAVRKAVLASLSKLPGCRVAEQGEFTRRAFNNGKTDLTRVEGLADLLEAETEAQRRQAFAQLDGRASEKCDEWRNALLRPMALLEATIDFSDEGDAPVEVFAEVKRDILGLKCQLENELRASSATEVIREGFRVAIMGPPNSGKSSLLNALIRRDVAIVTDLPGTTRDILEVPMDLGGMLIRFHDTAGIRETSDLVESIGIERALAVAKQADLVLWLQPLHDVDGATVHQVSLASNVVQIFSKSDLAVERNSQSLSGIKISSHTGAGISELLQFVASQAKMAVGQSESGIVVQERHKQWLERSVEGLKVALLGLDEQRPEIVCEQLRLVKHSLERIVGLVGAEDILGEIFSRFCIGK